jgi:hypothetical protein
MVERQNIMSMKSHIGKISLFSAFSLSVLLVGCAPVNETQQRAAIQRKVFKDQKKIEHLLLAPPVIPKAGNIETYDVYYPVRVPRMAEWLQKPVEFKGKTQLKMFIQQCLQGTSIIPLYQGGADSNKTITIDTNGSVHDLLQQLSEQTGYDFEASDHGLVISDVVTRAFHIDSVPGETDFDVGKSQDQYDIGSITSGDTGSSSNNNSSQLSQEKGSVSVWKDVELAVKPLLSSEGKLDVAQSGSQVTITDHYLRVKAASDWIKNYNQTLSQQVHFKVEILTVNVGNAHDRNFNFNLYNLFSTAMDPEPSDGISFDGSPGLLAPPSGIDDPNEGGQSLTLSGGNIFKFALKALSTQGRTTLQNQTVMTAINNHTAQLRQTISTTYLSEIKVSHDSGSGGSSQDIEYKPGQVTTGLELYILPHIEGEKVKMRISMSLADLTRMDSKDISGLAGGDSGSAGSGGGGNNVSNFIARAFRDGPISPCQPGGDISKCSCQAPLVVQGDKCVACPSGSVEAGGKCVRSSSSQGSHNVLQVQFPQVETRKFNQDAVVVNGHTLVLGGFRTNLLWMGANKNFGSPLLGAYEAAQQNTILVLLITPYVTHPLTANHENSDDQ